jgi:hypothetical protein
MKTLSIAAILALAIASSTQGGALTPQQAEVECHTSSPTGCSNELPTAEDFGDSVSLMVWWPAHKALKDKVDFEHNSTDGEPQNDGCMETMYPRMVDTLANQKYTIIVFNSGVHDIQHKHRHKRPHKHPEKGCGDAGLDVYRDYAEKAAVLAEQHSTFVIVADTVTIRAGDMPGIPADAQGPYNQILHDIAKEHGFYMWTPTWTGRKSGNLHPVGEAGTVAGNDLAACLLTVLGGQETADCHH